MPRYELPNATLKRVVFDVGHRTATLTIAAWLTADLMADSDELSRLTRDQLLQVILNPMQLALDLPTEEAAQARPALQWDEIGHVTAMRSWAGATESDEEYARQVISWPAMERVKLIWGWHLGDPSWALAAKEFFESQGLYLTTDPTARGVLPVEETIRAD